MEEKPEVLVEIRESGISIQSPFIGDDTSEAREVLERALAALDKDNAEKEVFKHEIVIKQ